MLHVEFELNVPPLRGDGAKNIKVSVEVSKGGRVPHHPVHPGGNFPPECKPHFAENSGKMTVLYNLIGGEESFLAPHQIQGMQR